MSTTAASTTPRAGAGRWTLTVLLALVIAAGLGLLGTLADANAPWWLKFTVFAGCGLGPAIGLAYIFVIGPTIPQDRHAEQSIELDWFNRALAGAALDIMSVLGISLFVLAITPIELSADIALLALLLLLMVDAAMRYVAISRRER